MPDETQGLRGRHARALDQVLVRHKVVERTHQKLMASIASGLVQRPLLRDPVALEDVSVLTGCGLLLAESYGRGSPKDNLLLVTAGQAAALVRHQLGQEFFSRLPHLVEFV